MYGFQPVHRSFGYHYNKYSNAEAITPLMAPLMIAFIFSGLAINQRVAPTICMVLIRKRLLNMASRMVLSIKKITTSEIIMTSTSSQILTVPDIFIQLTHQCFRVIHIANIGLCFQVVLMFSRVSTFT